MIFRLILWLAAGFLILWFLTLLTSAIMLIFLDDLIGAKTVEYSLVLIKPSTVVFLASPLPIAISFWGFFASKCPRRERSLLGALLGPSAFPAGLHIAYTSICYLYLSLTSSRWADPITVTLICYGALAIAFSGAAMAIARIIVPTIRPGSLAPQTGINAVSE